MATDPAPLPQQSRGILTPRPGAELHAERDAGPEGVAGGPPRQAVVWRSTPRTGARCVAIRWRCITRFFPSSAGTRRR